MIKTPELDQLTTGASVATEAGPSIAAPAAQRPAGGAALVAAAAVAAAEAAAGPALACCWAEDEWALGLHLQPRTLNLHAFTQQSLRKGGAGRDSLTSLNPGQQK